MRVTLRATCDEQTVETSYARPSSADGVTEHVVAEAGVVGPAVPARARTARGRRCSLGGSDGGPGGPVIGALLAGHGVPGAVAGATGATRARPTRCATSTSRSSAAACDWLRAQDGVDDVPPCVVGLSRGGELALLAACPDARPGRARSPPWSAAACRGALGAGHRRARDGLAVRRRAGAADGRGRGRPRRLHRRRGAWWRPPRSRSSARPGPVLLLSGEDDADVAERPAEPDRRGRAPSVRARPTGSPTSPTPTPGTSARRRPASRCRLRGRASAAAAAGRGNQAARLDCVATDPRARGSGPMTRAARTASASPTGSSGCGRRTGWPTSAARTSRPTARRGSARSAGSPGSTTRPGWSCGGARRRTPC